MSLLVALPAAGCTSADDAPSGDLRMGLIGSDAAGNLYRLRDGTFDISGPSPVIVTTEDSPDPVESLTVALPEGPYAVLLLDGWRVEEWDAMTDVAQDVTAVLTSVNPVDVDVMAEITSPVVFEFFVDGAGVVPMGDGGVDIDASFSDACALITDQMQCDALMSCEWNVALASCVEAGGPPASGTLEWTSAFDSGAGAADSFAAVDVDAQGRIVAVGRSQSPMASLLVQYDAAGAQQFAQTTNDERMTAVAFDDMGLAWIGVSGAFSGTPAGAAQFDLDTAVLTLGALSGTGPVLDLDALSGAAFLDAGFFLTRVAPSGITDWTQNVQLGGTPLAVATDQQNPAQPLVLSRDGGQLRLRRWDIAGFVSEASFPLLSNGGADMEATAGGGAIVAAADGANVSIARIDDLGTFQMLTVLATSGGAQLLGLDVSAAGDAVVGYEVSGQTHVARVATSDGSVQWEQNFPPAVIEGTDVAIAPDAAVYLVGSVLSGSSDAVIMRFAP